MIELGYKLCSEEQSTPELIECANAPRRPDLHSP